MTINIQNASNVNVTGHRTNKNCKAVYCITTGEIYASVIDAAEANNVTVAAMSGALCGRVKLCKGKRFCYVSRMMEHLEEINAANRMRIAKVEAYDADLGRRNAIADTQQKIEQHERNIALLQRKLTEETCELEEAKAKLNSLKNGEV